MYNAIIKFNSECLHDKEVTSTFEVTIFQNGQPVTTWTFRTLEGAKKFIRCFLTKRSKNYVNS